MSPTTAPAVLLTYLWRHAAFYGTALLLIVGSNLAQIQIPPILGHFTNRLQDGELVAGDPWRFALLLAGWALLYAALLWVAQQIVHRLARRFEFHVRNRLFSHWEALSNAYYTHHSVGDLMAHATNDVQAVRQAISSGIVNGVNAVSSITLVISAMVANVDARLALYSLAPLPLLTIIIAVLRPKIKSRFRAVQNGFSLLTERTQESLSGVRVVKAYAQEPFELERFRQAADEIVQRTLHLTRISALFNPLIQLVGAVAFLISLGYGGIRVIDGDLSLGALVAFNAFLILLINPMQQIGQVIDFSQRASSALGRLTTLFQEVPDVEDPPRPAPVRRLNGEIVFHHLSFAYDDQPDQPVLKEINLVVKPGTTVAILGRTGSGKSTLASLLLRVHNPHRGALFLDGHDVLDIPLALLRHQIAYVPQDAFLFSASVRENIALASDDYTPADVERAARVAQFYENILRFPDQFETEIGERGVTLSGGQRQRLAIARAIIKEAPLLILDDCFSAVDTATEAAILTGLRQLRGRRTTLIIAHRISTVRHADEIIVLEYGRISERGTHESLLAAGGLYREVYDLQREGTAVESGNSTRIVGRAEGGSAG